MKYFVSWHWRAVGTNRGGFISRVINVHTIEWMVKRRKEMPDFDMTLISWQRITGELYGNIIDEYNQD